ncbi:MAG TPA: 4-hydroxyphenylacetate 3-hydroxylase N-terminal domain-containing protein [Candidatus Binataceae bacterium]
MGARSGNNYLSALKKLGAEIWLGNERIRDVTSHPAFASRARATASIYDMQIENPEAMTFRTEDGGRAGLSFIQPRSAEELRKRGKMIKTWADYTCGFPADTPDLVNVSLAAMDAAQQFFGASDSRHGDNVQRYYREARNHDWRATEALPDPGRSETGVGGATAAEPLKTVGRNDAGLVVSGSRRLPTSAPLCEELLVLPSITLETGPAAEPLANEFAIPCNTRGLRIVCRGIYNPERPLSDHPLRPRFDQLECIAVFDRVVVPWERVFLAGDVARCNAEQSSTNSAIHRAHLVAVHNLATAEFLLGLAAGIAHDAARTSSPGVRERLAQMIVITESLRAHLHDAQADAAADRWGVFVPARGALGAVMGGSLSGLYRRLAEIAGLCEEPPAHPDQPVTMHELVQMLARNFSGGPHLASQASALDDSAGTASLEDTDLKPLIDRTAAFLSRAD